MKNLIVDTPSGKQEVISVGIGGGYFDTTLVVWDERINGPIPPEVVSALGSLKRAEDGSLNLDDKDRKAIHEQAVTKDTQAIDAVKQRKNRLKALASANTLPELKAAIIDIVKLLGLES